ncbi:MAG: cadherin domain-containing protein [Candidatus Thiodiazotropha lotti]|nr:cadherin domain-containing protein [Candidatus Thiodiazotropha lotti]MCW4186380.1 cadherin domain-containing protein [Candidatus Thiodiazotropha lotti]
MSGADTVANYQQVLRTITYDNSAQNPTTVARTITFVANDGTDVSNTGTTTVTVNAVNDAPVNSVPVTQSTNVDTPLVLSVANGNAISITDVDAGSSSIEVSLESLNGVMTLSGTAGLAFAIGDGTADATMTFSGSVSDINAALDGLTFSPNASYAGVASLTVTTSDLGNTGTGGTLVDKDVVAITVGATTFQEGVDGYVGSEDTELHVINPDTALGANTSISIDLDNLGGESQGLIKFGNIFGSGPGQIPYGSTIHSASLTIQVFDPSGAATTVSLHQMLSAWDESSTWNSVTSGLQLDNIEASSVADSTMTLAEFTGQQTFYGLETTLQAWADGATNHGWAIVSDSSDGWDFYSSEHGVITERPVLTIDFSPPVAAVLDLDANDSSGQTGADFATTFTEDGGAVAITDTDATLSDSDDTHLQSLTVTITNLSDGASESLAANTSGTSIVANYNSGTGVLTLSGNDTVANYQQVLRTISYDNTSQSPTTSDRSITFVANDGVGDSNIGTATVGVVNVNDTPTGSVSIDNMSPAEDDTLTASNTLADADGLSGAISYQWQRDGVDIAGAAASTYTTVQADVGTVITVVASYTDDQGTAESVTSAGTAAVTNVNDAPTGSVTISGTPTEDQILTASNTLADEDGMGVVSYQWQRDGVDIGGATGSTYTLGDADVGATITVVASYIDGQGTAEGPLTSAQTAAVANVNDVPTGSVLIDNMSPAEGDTLTASNTLADADGLSGAISYQWQRDGVDIAGATGSTYTTVQADVGALVTVVASYTDDWGTAESVTSGATTAVTNVNDAPTGSVTISGTPTEDETLTASNSLADEDGLGAISYQWQRDGVDITGATASTYTLGDADVGATITVVASYTDGQGTPESVTSGSVGPVANINDAPVGVPTITGTVEEDQTLTADTSGISDADGLGAFSYQWLRDGVAISGATASTYTLGDLDVSTQISVQVSFTDGYGMAEGPLTSAQTAPVANVNDVPVITSDGGGATASHTIAENTTAVTTVTATDIDLDTLTYSISGGTDSALFSINNLTGVLSFTAAPDFEAPLDSNSDNIYEVIVQVDDGQGGTDTQTITVTVTDVNEASVSAISDADASADTVLENSANGTLVGITASANDPDGTDTVTYSLDDNAGGRFAVDANTGVIRVAGLIDREAAASYDVTVRATSTDTSFSTRTFTINIGDEDEFDITAISDIDATLDAVDENALVGTTVGITALASDGDATDNIAYTLDDNAGGLFAIEAGTGVVTVAGALDAESATSHNITVRATSTDGSFSTQTYSIGVNDLDEFDITAVSDSDGSVDAVDENSLIGTTVGITAFADDSDITDSVSYSLDDNASGLFAIDAGTGVVTVAGALDAEVATSHNITVRATSTDGSFSTQAYTIAVNDLDEFDVTAISDTDGTADAVDENAAIGTTVGVSAFAGDADVTDSVSYSLDDNAGGLFAIDAGTGVVTVAGALDAETATSHNIIVRATSTDGSFSTQSYAIAVNDLDEFDISPVSDTDGTADAVDENSAIGTTVGVTAFANDSDVTDSVSYSLDDNAGGLFSINAGTGLVTVASALDTETATSHNITVRATSTDGSFSTQTYTIAVNDLDEFDITAISDTDGAANAVDENSAIGTTVGITAFADDADVTDGVSYSLDDNAGGRFAIDAGTGVVTVAGVLDAESASAHNITVRATSGDGSFSTQTYTIAINDVDEFDVTLVNDTDGSANVVDENSAIGTAVGVTAFADDADLTDSVSYSLNDNAGGRFAIDNITGVITVAGSLDYETASAHNVVVRASSTDGSFSTRSFSIGVNDLNDNAPTIVSGQRFSLAEDALTGTSVGFVSSTDVDTVGALQNWQILGGNTDGIFALNAATGEITVADPSALDFEIRNSYTLQIQVSDGVFDSATETLVIDITNINEAPTTSGIANVSVTEDAPDTVVDLFVAFDDTEQADTDLTYSVVGNSNPALFESTAINPTTGELRLDYGTNQNGTAQLTVRATDPLGLWTETSFDVLVDAANDSPLAAVPATQSTQSNTALVFSNVNGNALSVTDVDAQASEIQVDLTTQQGTLTLGSTQRLTFMSGDGNQDTQVSVSGTVAAINAALDGMSFVPKSGWAGSTSVQMRVDDLGNHGSGGALADIRTVSIRVLESESGPTTPTAPSTPSTGPSTPPPMDSFILDLDDDEDKETSSAIEIKDSEQQSSESIAADTEASLQSEEVRLFGDSASVFATVDLADDDTRRALGKFVKVKQMSFGAEQAGILETLKFLGENGQKLVDHVIWGQLDELGAQMSETEKEDLFSSDSIAFKTAAGISFTLSAGYVTWLLNSGSLAASMLSLTPLWTHFDPIPIATSGATKINGNTQKLKPNKDLRNERLNENIESMFDSD